MKEIGLGTIGAGRATELHMKGLQRYSGAHVKYKMISARRHEQVMAAQKQYGFESATLDYHDILNDPDIDVVDICTPPYVHEEMILEALAAGKHVICEKPLSGYFGMPGDPEPIGDMVSKQKMYAHLLESMEKIREAVKRSGRKFMYAENFVYAPAIQKAAEIISKKESRILFAKGEESLKGSSSAVAGEWNRTGGGTFIRTGAHPLTAILYLKSVEAAALQKEIRVTTVTGNMARITTGLSPYEHRHIAAQPHDVEDFGTALLTFSDGSRALVIATDTLLGGSKNYVDLYCNDAAINCRLTMNNLMDTYFLDEDRLDDVYISEMLPSKTGWNSPFLEDEIIRGYVDEMRDFMDAIYYDREPLSGIDVACDTTKIIYAAYMSAELGHAVEV